MSNFPKPQPGQTGYLYVGCGYGTFQTQNGNGTYCNIFVLSPISADPSKGRYGVGWRAEKLRCVSPDVFKGLETGDRIDLDFDRYERVKSVSLLEEGESDNSFM